MKNPSSLGFVTMPAVLTIFGLRVVVYPNDHRPAHVHVIGDGCEAIFKLNCPKGPPELRENYGFQKKTLNKIVKAISDDLAILCTRWKEIHGPD